MKRERGQSMTEFAVGLASFSLLLLGSLTLAGYQEVQRRLAISARNAAFAVAWSAGRVDPSDEARRVAATQMSRPLLENVVGRDPIVNPDGTGGSAGFGPVPERADSAVNAMLLPLQMAGGFLGRRFDLDPGGLLSGAVHADIVARPYLPEPFDALGLPLRQPFALLTDAWNAGNSDHVRQRVAGLVPTDALGGLQSLWRPLLAPLTLVEPSLARLCLGLIEPDRVPEDRLGSGRSPLPGRCP